MHASAPSVLDVADARTPDVSGYSDPDQECLDLLADLHNLVQGVEEDTCQVSVCIEGDGGWKHDPTSDEVSRFNGHLVGHLVGLTTLH